jgi:hypothetical protein
MKKLYKLFGVIAIGVVVMAVSAVVLAGCDNGSTSDNGSSGALPEELTSIFWVTGTQDPIYCLQFNEIQLRGGRFGNYNWAYYDWETITKIEGNKIFTTTPTSSSSSFNEEYTWRIDNEGKLHWTSSRIAERVYMTQSAAWGN